MNILENQMKKHIYSSNKGKPLPVDFKIFSKSRTQKLIQNDIKSSSQLLMSNKHISLVKSQCM